MARYLFDCETNGLLPELTTIHSLVLRDVDTGELLSCAADRNGEQPGGEYSTIEAGLKRLMDASMIVAHNAIGFDVPALQKVFPWFKPRGTVRDTLVLTRVLWPDIEGGDYARARAKKMPTKLIGRHSLEAWGYRLGLHKGDYKDWCEGNGLDPWAVWRPEMQEYCELDVDVLAELWRRCGKRLAEWGVPIEGGAPGADVIDLEHDVAGIIRAQEEYGFGFDVEAAGQLAAELMGRRVELSTELRAFFPSWEVRTTFVPKANNKKLGYQKGVPFTRVKVVEFNPSSRKHIASRLIAQRGWEPSEFTKDGTPKVDEDTLKGIEWPEAKVLVEYFVVEKTLGMLAEGKQAWMKLARNGRIHGRVNSNGAVTGRMTHSNPNVAQTPSGKVAYGMRCRGLFIAGPGKVLVGCDADALELRDLAGYMRRYDGGAYVETVLYGDKAKGSDMHSTNCRALGYDPTKLTGQGKETWRDVAKVWFYAFIYGAGNQKLGFILGVKGEPAIRPRDGSVWYPAAERAGKRSRDNFMRNLPALGQLAEAVKTKARAQKWLRGLDGRRLSARSEHAALNTLLQSAGAIQMKAALVLCDRTLTQAGLSRGQEYAFVANIHDEVQMEVDEKHATFVGKTMADSIRLAGERYNFGCPLAGNFDIGATWAETH